MPEIVHVCAREILDCLGHPTVECEVETTSGAIGRAAVPSGASTGDYEALELRDRDRKRFFGRGVRRAVANITDKLGPAIRGLSCLDQTAVDQRLLEIDGSPNQSSLGANAILAVSLATARAAAEVVGIPLWRYLGGVQARVLPTPLVSVLNGGIRADRGPEIRQFMIVPSGLPSFIEALRCGAEIFHTLRSILAQQGLTVAVGDEGGLAVRLESNQQAIELVLQAIEQAGYEPAEQVCLALDAAADAFYCEGQYTLDGQPRSAAELVEIYATWCDRYPLVSIEDGLAHDDWEGWKLLTERLGRRVQLLGADLFFTRRDRLLLGIERGVGNAILIKPNQAATLTETLETMRLATWAHYASVVSHRSGDTEDSFIADLVVATNAGQIKTGSVCRSERIAKYNQLLRIAEELDEGQIYAGREPYQRLRPGAG